MWHVEQTPQGLCVRARRYGIPAQLFLFWAVGLTMMLLVARDFASSTWDWHPFLFVPLVGGVVITLVSSARSQLRQARMGPVLLYDRADRLIQLPRTGQSIHVEALRLIEVVCAKSEDGEDSCECLVLVSEDPEKVVRHDVVLVDSSNASAVAEQLGAAWSVPIEWHTLQQT